MRLPSATRRVRLRWLVLLVVLGLPLVAEGASRLLLIEASYMHAQVFAPELGYRQPAHASFDGRDPEGRFAYRTNAFGFRGPELPAAGEPPAADTARLVFLGDSFLDGWDVRPDALIPFSCEAELRARGRAVEVFNVCGAGIGTAQELILFRRHVADLRADVVVLALYSGNDVIDNTPELVGRTGVSSGAYVRPFLVDDGAGGLETRWLNPFRTELRKRSRLFQLVEVKLLTAGWIDDPAGRDRVPSVDECIAAGRLPDTSLDLFLPPAPGGPWQMGLERTENLLRVFRDEVQASGARFVLASIPHRYQVEEVGVVRALDDALRRAGQPTIGERVDWNLPEERLAAFTAAEGIAFVPLLDALRAATTAERRSCYLHDGHLAARGHRVAGALVARALEEVLAGRPVPRAAVPAGAPVDLLGPEFVADGRIDFAEDLHAEVLSWGWLWWMSVGATGAAGWHMGSRRATLYAPARPGELVVEGWVMQGGATLRLFVHGEALHAPVALAERGPLEVRIPFDEVARALEAASDPIAADGVVELEFVLQDPKEIYSGRFVLTGVRIE